MYVYRRLQTDGVAVSKESILNMLALLSYEAYEVISPVRSRFISFRFEIL